MSNLGYKYVGVAYVDDPYGASWKDAFVAACSAMKCKDADGNPTADSCPIQVITSGLIGGDQESVEQSVAIFKEADVKIGFIVTFDDDMNFFMDEAMAEGMVGEEYFWIFGDGIMTAAVEASGDVDPLRAHGYGRLSAIAGLVGNPHYDAFVEAWAAMDADTDFVAYAESLFHDYTADAGSQANLEAGAGGGWHPEGTDLSVFAADFFATNFPDDVAIYAYDAVMAIALGACDYRAEGGTFDADFQGSKYFAHITKTDFASVSGNPTFLPTGSRDPASANFVLENFLCTGTGEGSCVR